MPKAEQDLEEWQTAVEALLLVVKPQWADHDGAHRYDEGAQSAGGRFVTLGLTRDISSKSSVGSLFTPAAALNSCNEGIAAVPADSLVEGDRCMAIAAAIRAAAYIMKLPKSKQQSPEWQAAGEAVIMAAEDRGPACSRRDDTGVARRKADSGIRFVEREALGTAKA